jgi:RHS repeat-associated protein
LGSGGSSQWNEYLFVYGEMVGERVNVINGAKTKFWFHKDHLGSIAALTNGTIGDPNLGSVVERDSYDAWGRQRHTNGTDDAVLTGSITSTVTRGYTGQEELADVSLIHYNGRVYDPLIARFTSPDPVVGQPESSQGWNRYAYVGNNPFAFTDPNGYCGFFCVLSHVFNPIQHFNDALAITRAIYSIPYLGQILNIATVAVVAYYCLPCAPYVASALSALQAGVTSGKIGEAFKAGAIAFAEAEAFAAVGGATNGDFNGSAYGWVNGQPMNSIGQTAGEWMQTPMFAANIAGHAAIGCAVGEASGSGCGAGAAGAGFGAIAAPVLVTAFPSPHDNFAQLMGGTLGSAGVGGLGSIVGGGKFENGAITAAFGYIFNSVGLACRQLATGGPFDHCSVFVSDDKTGNIQAQYSLQGLHTTFDPQGSTSDTARDDLTAFQSPGGRNLQFEISPPAGTSSKAFDQLVIDAGNTYRAPGNLYLWLMAPNSNSAAASIIERAGGQVPLVPRAPGLNFYPGLTPGYPPY